MVGRQADFLYTLCWINDSCHAKFDYEIGTYVLKPNEISNGFWEIFHLPLPYKLNILPKVSSMFVWTLG